MCTVAAVPFLHARSRVRAAPEPTGEELRRAGRIVLVLIGVTLAVQVFVAFREHGGLWPDEVHQTLEQGHRLAFGYGFVPWEFQDGVRSWVAPGVLAGWLRMLDALGVASGLGLVIGTKLLLAALVAVGALAAARLAGAIAGPTAAIVCAGLSAAFPASLVLGTRPFTESLGAPLVVGAAALLCAGPRTAARAAIAGAIGALATLVRYQNGLFAVGLLLVLVVGRRWRDARAFALGGAAVALAGGALDWATWGSPFHSLVGYVGFNARGADAFGVAPASFYLRAAWDTLGPWLIILAGAWIAAARRAPALTLVIAAFVLVHAAIPHKELRFLYPAVPLALALAGVGLGAAIDRLAPARRQVVALALGAVASASFAWQASRLTFGDLGMFARDAREAAPVWGFYEGLNRGLSRVGERADACGVLVAGVNPIWTGGFSYLHRDIPFLHTPDALSAANYAIVPDEIPPPPGYARIAREQRFVLYRREGTCEPPPPGTTRRFLNPRSMPGPSR